MVLKNRRRLFCEQCKDIKWALLQGVDKVWRCKECNSEVSVYSAQKKMAEMRRRQRIEKAKWLGTYQSKEEKKALREANKRETDPHYVWWVHQWNCCVPGCSTPFPVHAHHVKSRGALGSDRTCVPLCPSHHTGWQGVHNQGIATFQERLSLNLFDLVEKYNRLYEERREGPHMNKIPSFETAKYSAT